ncbi:autotransporter outer membrane beta-barrel domain-containing protein (plasmid) [Pantoea sp. S-LA4]
MVLASKGVYYEWTFNTGELMEINTQPLLLAVAIIVALTNQATAAYTPLVNAGTTVNNEVIAGSDNAQQVVNGIANNTTINSGSQYIFGVANNTTLLGGTQYIIYGGESNVVTMSGGALLVNGATNDVTATAGILSINSGLNGTVDSATGGSMNRTVLSGSAFLENRFGIDTDTIVNSGGILQTGSNLDNDWIDTAISNNTVINEGGLQTVDNHGTSNNSIVNKGGTLQILYFLHNKTETDKSGLQYGTANNTTVYGEMQNNGGIDNNTLVKAGASFTLTGSTEDGQQALSNNAILEDGVTSAINDNGQANNWTVSGATVTLNDDTSTISDSIFNSGNLLINKGNAVNTVLNSGQMSNAGGIDSNTVIQGGQYTLGGTEAATATDLLIQNGASAIINSGTLTNATINGTLSVNPNAARTDTTSTLQGNIAVNDGGQLTLVGGADTRDADLTLSGTGNLHLSDGTTGTSAYAFALGAVTMNGGSIYFDPAAGEASQAQYSSLTLNSLNGSGAFYMNSDLSSVKGNFLTVTGEADGNFDLYIADTGTSPASASALQVIQTGGGDADFTLANNGHVVDVGTYQYYLIAEGNGSWALSPQAQTQPDPTVEPATDPVPDAESDPQPATETPAAEPTPAPAAGADEPAAEPTPAAGADQPAAEPAPAASVDDPVADPIPATTPDEPAPTTEPVSENPAVSPVSPSIAPTITPSTAAVLSMATVDPLIFQSELSAVRSRLDQARVLSHDTNVWGHFTTSRYNLSSSAGAGYDMDVNGVTIGADKAEQLAEGIFSQGLFFTYSHSKVDFDRGGNGKVDSYSAGAYASYLDDSGLYFDGVLKINRFRHDINARMTSGTVAEDSYTTTGIGTNLQAGKYFHLGAFYIAPYASVMGFTSTSQDYALSNGMKAHSGAQHSVIGEAGVNLGHEFLIQDAQIQPYLKLAVAQEFIDDNEVRVNDDRFTNDVSGTRGVYQLGVNAKLTDRLSVHTDAGYTQGDRIESPWTANLGMSWSF